MIKRQWKFLVVLLAGALSAIFDFGLHLQPIFTNFTFMGVTGITYSEILIDIIGIYTAINMAIEMIGDIRRGRWCFNHDCWRLLGSLDDLSNVHRW